MGEGLAVHERVGIPGDSTLAEESVIQNGGSGDEEVVLIEVSLPYRGFEVVGIRG